MCTDICATTLLIFKNVNLCFCDLILNFSKSFLERFTYANPFKIAYFCTNLNTMEGIHYISSDILDLSIIKEILDSQKKLALSEEAQLNINKSRDYLINKMKDNETPVYGINTGFGSLCNVKITSDNLSKLQENLVMSHACGTGSFVTKPIVKLMLLLKIQSLSYGYSGVQLQTVERLIEFYNNEVLPVIYTQGSLGASGDLA